MSKRVLVLVEGQTEERFVKDVLAPVFWTRNVFFEPRLLITKLVKHGVSFKGGVTNFAKFSNDMERLLAGSRGALVTTILDYYGLPTDFPGMNSRPANGTPLQRVTHIESNLALHFNNPRNLVPFFALHEFEAWLFSSPDVLPRVMTEMDKQPEFKALCESAPTPEAINERPQFAPSKRIESLFPAYKKTLHGPNAARHIGIEQIRARCPHFDSWLKQLEEFAAS